MQKMTLCHGVGPVTSGQQPPLQTDPRLAYLIRVYFLPHKELFDPLGRV